MPMRITWPGMNWPSAPRRRRASISIAWEQRRRTVELRYWESMQFGPLTLTLYPAGHCLGSAMLLADDGEKRLLFTGDFKLGPSATCEEAELPEADILVMESTFGKPKYRLPPREETVAELGRSSPRDAIELGMTPVIHAYALGKAQEVTRLLTLAGINVQQHPTTFAVSQVYRQCGIDLGDVTEYKGRLRANHAVVTLPRGMKNFRIAGIKHPVSIAVTGWAVDKGAKYRYRVDHALPLSDHADYDQFLETAQRVGAARDLLHPWLGGIRRASLCSGVQCPAGDGELSDAYVLTALAPSCQRLLAASGRDCAGCSGG